MVINDTSSAIVDQLLPLTTFIPQQVSPITQCGLSLSFVRCGIRSSVKLTKENYVFLLFLSVVVERDNNICKTIQATTASEILVFMVISIEQLVLPISILQWVNPIFVSLSFVVVETGKETNIIKAFQATSALSHYRCSSVINDMIIGHCYTVKESYVYQSLSFVSDRKKENSINVINGTYWSMITDYCRL